jgi:DNA gyrase/topoisomerase IV subunit B
MMEVVSDCLDRPQLAYSEEEGQRLCNEIASGQKHVATKRRFRGLASLSVETLLHCCVQPATRKMFQLTAHDAEASLQLMAGFNPRHPTPPSSRGERSKG